MLFNLLRKKSEAPEREPRFRTSENWLRPGSGEQQDWRGTPIYMGDDPDEPTRIVECCDAKYGTKSALEHHRATDCFKTRLLNGMTRLSAQLETLQRALEERH